MKTCYIVGASPFCERFLPDEGDLVIAADGGWQALTRLGIRPHLVVGDFDSSEAPASIPTIRHPVEKDETDTALAVAEGRTRGYRRFVFYGCTGGRPDHTLASIQSLHRFANEGAEGYLVGEGMVGTVIVNGSLHFSPKGTVSVFSLTDISDGVTLKGLKYPLTDARLSARVPLGVSNSAFGTPAEISVKCGALYVLWEADSVDFRTVKRYRLS